MTELAAGRGQGGMAATWKDSRQMAIYTALSKKDIGKIVEEFAVGDLVNFTGMRTGSVNTHYLIETKRGKFFLKIDEVKSEVEAKQEIDLLLHLRKQNFPCVQPLKTKSGRFHLDFQGKCLTVTRHIEGAELPVESLNSTHLNALGHALANLHLIGRSYKKGIDNRFGYNRIVAIYREVRRQLPSHLKNIVRVLDDEFSYLESYLDNNLPKGIIHGDLFPDNVKFKGNRLTGIMDFEAACRGKLIYDLATAVNALCFLEDRYRIDRFEALISGYETLRPLSLPEADAELERGKIAEAGAMLAEAADPVDDSRASAHYRRRVIPRMLARAFAEAGEQAYSS